MGYNITTQPAYYPVRLQDMKAHLDVDYDTDDDLIMHLIMEAVGAVESYLRGALISTTYTITMDDLEDIQNFDRFPLQSVTSVKYYDTDDAQQTLATASYRVDTNSKPPRLEIVTMPSYKDRINAIEVIAVFGWSDANDIPKEIIQAIKKKVKDWYDCPGDPVRNMTTATKRLLDMHRMKMF